MSYDNNRQIIVSKVVSDKPNAPKLRASTEFDGVKWQAGLWPMTRKDGSVVTDKNGNTLYKGTFEVDDYKPGNDDKRQPPGPVSPPSSQEFNDGIPF